MDPALQRLEHVITGIGPLAVAVSGGVDSTTLAAVAHRVHGADARMLHAVSPAVPADATARVRAVTLALTSSRTIRSFFGSLEVVQAVGFIVLMGTIPSSISTIQTTPIRSLLIVQRQPL